MFHCDILCQILQSTNHQRPPVCAGLKGRFQQYYVNGSFDACHQWLQDYKDCTRYITTGDVSAAVSCVLSSGLQYHTHTHIYVCVCEATYTHTHICVVSAAVSCVLSSGLQYHTHTHTYVCVCVKPHTHTHIYVTCLLR